MACDKAVNCIIHPKVLSNIVIKY